MLACIKPVVHNLAAQVSLGKYERSIRVCVCLPMTALNLLELGVIRGLESELGELRTRLASTNRDGSQL